MATRTLPKSGTWASIKGLSGILHPPDPSWISRSLLEHIPGSREYLVICAAPYMLQSQPLPVHRELSAPARRSTRVPEAPPQSTHLSPAHFSSATCSLHLMVPDFCAERAHEQIFLTSSVLSKGFTGSHHYSSRLVSSQPCDYSSRSASITVITPVILP